jgi:hypothetical protein
MGGVLREIWKNENLAASLFPFFTHAAVAEKAA